MDRRFTLSRSHRKLLGVCGGIADYFTIDPMIVRIGFVIGTLAFGLPVILYPIIALVAD